MPRMIEVDTGEGPVRGLVEDGVATFRGVPFAEPPTGSLRFRAPVPPAVRDTTFDATGPAAVCPQPPSRLAVALGEQGGRQEEDCLTVSVWSPLPLDQPRPMLVWFHGGAFVSGGAAIPWYDGARLARDNDIVVVGVNYRLGALGFLCRPGLVDGNMGLLDQIRGLEWVTENAASFGGDPSRVTVIGQSAGAMSIACMLALPSTRRLFGQAILVSGGLIGGRLPTTDAPEFGERFCASLGIEPDDPDALARLQDVSLEQIFEAQLAVMRNAGRPPGDMWPVFIPAVTSGLPGGSAFEAAVAAGARSISVVVGTTAEEMRIFEGLDPRLASLTQKDLPDVAQGMLGPSGPDRVARARTARPAATPTELLTLAYTEWSVDEARRLAVLAAQGAGDAWLFRFDWSAPDSGFGACHCLDLPFIFGTFDAFAGAPMLVGGDRVSMESLSAVIRSAIGRFVRSGSPAGGELPEWPPVGSAEAALMVFDAGALPDCTVTNVALP
jgi:para-nitrobenzyl esterase